MSHRNENDYEIDPFEGVYNGIKIAGMGGLSICCVPSIFRAALFVYIYIYKENVEL